MLDDPDPVEGPASGLVAWSTLQALCESLFVSSGRPGRPGVGFVATGALQTDFEELQRLAPHAGPHPVAEVSAPHACSLWLAATHVALRGPPVRLRVGPLVGNRLRALTQRVLPLMAGDRPDGCLPLTQLHAHVRWLGSLGADDEVPRPPPQRPFDLEVAWLQAGRAFSDAVGVPVPPAPVGRRGVEVEDLLQLYGLLRFLLRLFPDVDLQTEYSERARGLVDAWVASQPAPSWGMWDTIARQRGGCGLLITLPPEPPSRKVDGITAGPETGPEMLGWVDRVYQTAEGLRPRGLEDLLNGDRITMPPGGVSTVYDQDDAVQRHLWARVSIPGLEAARCSVPHRSPHTRVLVAFTGCGPPPTAARLPVGPVWLRRWMRGSGWRASGVGRCACPCVTIITG